MVKGWMTYRLKTGNFCYKCVSYSVAWSNYFDLWAVLQKRDNFQATSNKMMYKTKYSQHLQLKN